MLDESAVEKFAELVREPRVVTVAGEERLLAPAPWAEIPRRPGPTPEPLKVGTLTGLVDYLERNPDQLGVETGVLVHVVSPEAVTVRARVEGEPQLFRRHTYAVATLELVGAPPIRFGQYLDAETFVIGLQAGFVGSPERDELVRLVSSIRENSVRETVDDGVAQEVKTARGVALQDRTPLPNPVRLAPYRTFREVAQPDSRFVLRAAIAKEGDRPTLALFEAEGNAWKLEAIRRVADYLREQLPGVMVLA